MFCPACGTAIQSGQRFCTTCGLAVVDTSVHTATTAVPTTPRPAAPTATSPTTFGAPLPPPSAPALQIAAEEPTVATPAVANDTALDATAALTVVEQTTHASYGHDPYATEALPAQGGDTGEQAVFEQAEQFRITPLVAVSAVGAVLAVAAAVTDIATVEITGDQISTITYALNDFATNNLVGAIIAAVLLVGGAALGATGRRVGSGLAGGAGLALAGMMAMMIGSVIGLFDSSEVALLKGGGSFTLTTTQEIGFWLGAIAAVLGIVAFVLAVTSAGDDGRPPIAAAFGIVGAVGTLLVVGGTLIPLHGASFADQFSNDATPPATLLLRLLVLLLIAVGGLAGFLSNRRWGVGLALGAISVAVWQWATSISQAGDLPFGLAGGNYGGTYTDRPHLLTTIGIVVMVLAALGAIGALVAANRRRV